MTKKASVYTKTGDEGMTGLVGGSRINKSSAQIELYGEVDELNSSIGLSCAYIKSEIKDHKDILESLAQVQNILFNLGSNLACEAELRAKFSLPFIEQLQVEYLEKKMDDMDVQLEKLTKFILPGGSFSSSSLHLCRTICRRLERKMCSGSDLPEHSLKYINRLSDYFFILSRYTNKILNIKEVTWN